MLIYERKNKIKDPLPLKKKTSLRDNEFYEKMLNQITKANTLQKIENILFSDEYTTRFVIQLIQEAQKMER